MTDTAPPQSAIARLGDGYWAESQRPLASLVFVTPLLAAYEAGVLVLGPAAARNGADVWLRTFLELVGFGQYFLLPLLTVSILLGWHYTTRQPWRVARGTLAGMAVESGLLAVCLWLILQLQGALLDILSVPGTLGGLVGYLGAGVYEELLFRLMLLPAVACGVRRLGVAGGPSLVAAAACTSLMFAAAHHVGPNGEPLDWFIFLFRFLAGLFFCALFIKRGFGIAAGTHAGYDILVGVFLARAA
jgi:membrane protease YdiL (CAAX protease family)